MRSIFAALLVLLAATAMAQQTKPSPAPPLRHGNPWGLRALVPSPAVPLATDTRGVVASFDSALLEAVCLTMTTNCNIISMKGDLRTQIAAGKADIAGGIEVVDLSADLGVFSVSYGRVPSTAPDKRRGASLAFLLKPGDKVLKERVDKALGKLLADGTIRRLAAKLFPYPLL
jgi:hypothetical protein